MDLWVLMGFAIFAVVGSVGIMVALNKDDERVRRRRIEEIIGPTIPPPTFTPPSNALKNVSRIRVAPPSPPPVVRGPYRRAIDLE